MNELRIVPAQTEEHFRAMSRIHAEGWRASYQNALPRDWMAQNITDERWVDLFRQYAAGEVYHGLLLLRGDTPVSCVTCGPARTDAGLQSGSICKFHAEDYAGWGEIVSFYTQPGETGKGYGSLLMNAALDLLHRDGFSNVYVYVLRENAGARKFYARHGFSWDGTHEDIPFPPDTVCVDLRYVKKMPSAALPSENA